MDKPKIVGISKRLLISIVVVLCLMMAMYFYFMHKYFGNRQDVSTHQPATTSVNTDADSATIIDKIKNEKHSPVVLNVGGLSPHHYNSVVASTSSLSDEDFKSASNAALSVYHDSGSFTSVSANMQPNHGGSTRGRGGQISDSQNMQNEKVAFLHDQRSLENDYIKSKLNQPISPYQIMAGTVIPATLISGINSDLPGKIIASVSRNIYDSATGNYLLIPQGTKIVGQYDSQVAYGQRRVLMVWNRLILPDSSSFDLKGMPGADLTGFAGLQDKVDNHYFKVFGSALMFSLFGAASQLSQPQTTGNTLTTQQIVFAAIGQQMSQAGSQMIAKNMNIQPTLKIRPGCNFNVLLTRDMVLPHPYMFKG